ncbi:hypothetical protein LCGC14_1088800 [marine sediment metagenome]|uniref:Uncharacterized protein n=1 Tax=marine sediment metagenome TaxID=412755 RepID=A0A0F9MHH3_9ZZZZ
MELDELIQQMDTLIAEALLDADDGNVPAAYEHMREAKVLLDDEFHKD